MSVSLNTLIPSAVMILGAAAGLWVGVPSATPLEEPFEQNISPSYQGYVGEDIPIDPVELKISGATEYLNRGFDIGLEEGPVQLYIGYHSTQQGQYKLHLPTVCLPGAGWIPVSDGVAHVTVNGHKQAVNRYVLQKDQFRILVYYWFQGRGHTTAEYADLKLNTLKDALKYRRDEEALARIVVPIPVGADVEEVIPSIGMTADSVAASFAAQLMPELERALPSAPAKL